MCLDRRETPCLLCLAPALRVGTQGARRPKVATPSPCCVTNGRYFARHAQSRGAAARGSSAPLPVSPVADPCPRSFAAGDVVQNPPALFSSNGVLSVRFSYQRRIDAYNRELFCFMTPDGLQNPTLHVKPGDHLTIT